MDEFWSWQGCHKTYCDRVSLLLWVFPTGVCMGRERRVSLGICLIFFFAGVLQSAKPGAHTARMLKKCVSSGTCPSILQACGERCYLSNAGLLLEGNRTVGTLTLAQLKSWTGYIRFKTEFYPCLRFCTLLWYVLSCVCSVLVSFLPLQTFPRVWVRKAFCTANITAAIPASSQRCSISCASRKFRVLTSFALS